MKGKKKKVFLISQLLQIFQTIYSTLPSSSSNSSDDSTTTATPLEMDERVKLLTSFQQEIPHLTLCWQSYSYLKGNEARLSQIFQSANVQVWESGLICARNELCSVIYHSLFDNNSREDQIASILSLKGTFVKSAICPPGCDCGWQFISASRPELQLDNVQLDLLPTNTNTNMNESGKESEKKAEKEDELVSLT